MIEAVFVFGLLNVMFEFILLSMLPVKRRLRLLGNEAQCVSLHFVCLALNLAIHWGTLIGTMSGIFAFICSLVTIACARIVFGKIVGTRYTRGVLGYKKSELV